MENTKKRCVNTLKWNIPLIDRETLLDFSSVLKYFCITDLKLFLHLFFQLRKVILDDSRCKKMVQKFTVSGKGNGKSLLDNI